MNMADFEVRFDGWYHRGNTIQTYYGYSKDSVVRIVKRDADKTHADTFDIFYLGSGKTIGRWEKRGSRWYKEW